MKNLILHLRLLLTITLLAFCNSNFAVSFPSNSSYMADEMMISESPFLESPTSFSDFERNNMVVFSDNGDEGPPDDPLEPENPTVIGEVIVPLLLCLVLYGIIKIQKSKRRKETIS
jgi:hypothetical protein